MNVKKIVTYYAAYAVGVYVLQRFVTKQLLPLPLAMVTDPIGSIIGYPPNVAPVGGVSQPTALSTNTNPIVALVSSQGG